MAYDFVLYNKYIYTRKEKYYQWWHKSEISVDCIVDDIFNYICCNRGLYRIIFNGYFIDTKYLRREKIYRFLFNYFTLNDFKWCKLIFDDWSITFFKGSDTNFTLKQFNIFDYL